MNPAKFLKSIVNRKSLIVLFFLSIVTCQLSIVTTTAHAQSSPSTTDCKDVATTTKTTIDQANKDAITGNEFDDKLFNLNQITGTTDSLLTMLTGCSLIHKSTNVATSGTGALAASGRMVASLYSAPPVSGVYYFANEIHKLNPIQPAYAQTGGIGFDTLQPVQDIWTAFRNMAYVGFIIVFVVIGFMVMFRHKISPQAVATVQDSIPRIIIALILVTFSYAIAGLMIDIMFVALNITIRLLVDTKVITNADFVFKESAFGAITGAWGDLVSTTFKAVNDLINKVVSLGTIGNILSWGLGGIGGAVAGLVVGIAVLFIMFRIFLMLLMSYVTIILLTIFAPFFFLIQALPGNNGAKTWFRQFTANLAVFPAVALMFILAGVLGGIGHFGGNSSPLIGRPSAAGTSGNVGQFPLFVGGLDVGAIGRIIGLGIVFMTPTAAQMVKNLMNVKEGVGGVGIGAAAGAAIGAGAGALTGPLGAATRPFTGAASYRIGSNALDKVAAAYPGGIGRLLHPPTTNQPPPTRTRGT